MVRKLSLESARKLLKLRGTKLQLRASIGDQRERLVAINQAIRAVRPPKAKGGN